MEYTDFAFIPQKPTEHSVFSRLGYSKKFTQLSDQELADIRRHIAKASTLCKSKARCMFLDITQRTEDNITLSNGLILKSQKLCNLLKDSQSILLMAATTDHTLMQHINDQLSDGDKVFGIILDAYASECVDDALSYVMKYWLSILVRQNKQLTKRRFSAGYGGLDIAYQKDIYDLLQLDELDITITDSMMLIPEKSVTAIAGVQQIRTQ